MKETPSGRSIAIEKTTIKTLSTLRTGSGLTMVQASGSDEADADLEKFLHLGQEFLVGDEDDQVVLGELHLIVFVPDRNFLVQVHGLVDVLVCRAYDRRRQHHMVGSRHIRVE